MGLLSLIAALLIDRTHPVSHRRLLAWFERYADRIAHDMNAGEPVHGTIGWLAAIGPWVLAVLLAGFLLSRIHPAVGWAWNAAVLYACIGFRRTDATLGDLFEALRASEVERARHILAQWRGGSAERYSETDTAKAAIETALVRAHRELFGVIFWFVLLGVTGAVLYRLGGVLAERWGTQASEDRRVFGRFAARAFHALDWIPSRLTAIGFAIAGNFEDAVAAWRSQASSWLDRDQGIVLTSGAGALGVRLGGPLPREGGVDYRPDIGEGVWPDADYLQSAKYLLWRTLIVWIVVLVLLTVARWAGS